MYNDFHFIASIPEESLRVLVSYVPGVVVADLGDDVAPLKHPISGGPKSYLNRTKKKNTHTKMQFSTTPLTFVTIRGAFTSAPPTKLKPHGVVGELRRNTTSSSLVLPPIVCVRASHLIFFVVALFRGDRAKAG